MGSSIVPFGRKYSRRCPRCEHRHWTHAKTNKAICDNCKILKGKKPGRVGKNGI